MKKAFLLLLVTLPLLFVSCSEDNNTNPDDNTTININSKGQIYMKIDGVEFHKVEITDKYYPGYGMIESANQITYISFLNENLGGIFDFRDVINIEKGRLTDQQIDLESWKAVFREFFETGDYEYALDSDGGIKIDYWDDDEVKWTTSFEGGDQTGSYFRIVSVRDELNNDKVLKIKTYIEFQCRVYDGQGNSKLLEGGRYVGYFSTGME